jgi:hypothetical protein
LILVVFSDADFLPVSIYSSTSLCHVTIPESSFTCGHILFMGDCPAHWKTHKEAHISYQPFIL